VDPNAGNRAQANFHQAVQQPAANLAQPVYEDPGIDYTLFNTDKSLMRTTTDRILNTPQLFKESQIPYGVVVKPFGDLPSVSNFS
jgi:hypothetical protein